jgi:hypothetical protein
MIHSEKRLIFISCGQRTQEEKELGQKMCAMVRSESNFEPYFAEFQTNFSGLNENILDALSQAVGLITVLHRRGAVQTDVETIRASVWVEQEIAIAAYIERTQKKRLLTAAYIEDGVTLEGLRSLLHLNPIKFSAPATILDNLQHRLAQWNQTNLIRKRTDQDEHGHLTLKSSNLYESGLPCKQLAPHLRNHGPRAKEYSCTIAIPSSLLTFTNCSYVLEIPSEQTDTRLFRITEANRNYAPIQRDENSQMLTIEIALMHLSEEQRSLVFDKSINIKAELDSHSYELSVGVRDIFGLVRA